MRRQFWFLVLGGIVLVGVALFVRIRTTPPIPSADDETLWGMALEHAKLGDAEHALQIAMRICNPDTRETALQSVADTFFERGDCENALRVIRSLSDPYLRILYFSNIVESGKLQKPDSESLIREAERDARRIRNERQSKFAWFSICRMWMKLGEIERAWELAQNLPKTQLRHGLWGELAVLFAQKGDVERALEIAAQLPDKWQEESGQPISPFGLSIPTRQQELLTNRQAVLKAIAETLAKQGKVDEATKIAQSLENEAVRSQVLDALADARKRVGMSPIVTKAAEGTLKFTRQIEQQLGTHGLFSPLTKSLEEQVALSKALNEARKLKTPEAKTARLVQIAMQFSYSPQRKGTVAAILAEATHYAREIKSLSGKVQALERIAMCWERIGERDKAQSLLNETRKIQQRFLEVFGLKRDIVMNAAQSGCLTKLKEVIRKAPDPFIADLLLEQTVVELARNGQVKEALALVNEMARGKYWRQILVRRIAWQLADDGKVEDALALAAKLSAPFEKVSLYRRVADVLRQRGQKERAIVLLSEALKLTDLLSEETRKFELAQIACSFARLGETNKALEVFSRSGLEDDNIRFEFALAFAEGGDFETALKFARQLPPERRNIAINSIAATAEHQGRKELAIKLRQEARTEQKW